MRISVIDTQEKILTKVLMLKGEKGDKGDPGELTNLDTELSTTSTNAVQNKVITKALNELLENSATNSFTDGIDSLFKKVVSSVVPVQAGSGTPSPSNPRAISGFTECVVKNFSKNFMPQKDVSVPNTVTNSYVTLDLPKGTYTISAKVSSDTSDTDCRLSFRQGTTQIEATFIGISTARTSVTVTLVEDCNRIYFYGGHSTTTYANTTHTDIQIERGSTATEYTPYVAPNTATISFGSAGTVYGGEVDLTTGVLTVDKGYISSYNGETLSGEWISSIDVYDGTNQPTIGAQVVYELATPQTYQLTPAQLRSLVGTNNLTSSTGEVTEVEYITNDTIAWLLDLINA